AKKHWADKFSQLIKKFDRISAECGLKVRDRRLPKKTRSLVVAIERIRPNYVKKPGFCVQD
ncbi:hypothetical protein, partial [Microcoleus sp. F4-D5]|uniref:hypothetical protein n=1 Tax=Microcoleus sp. F4-D5 TaxID=2818760 RepID=UPI002FD0EBC7